MVEIPHAIPNSPECEAAAKKAHQIIVSALERQNITVDYLAEKLKAELEAKEVKVFNHLGEVIYSQPLVAWKVRQEARKDAHKLLDHYPHGDLDLDERPILVVMPKAAKKEVAE